MGILSDPGCFASLYNTNSGFAIRVLVTKNREQQQGQAIRRYQPNAEDYSFLPASAFCRLSRKTTEDERPLIRDYAVQCLPSILANKAALSFLYRQWSYA